MHLGAPGTDNVRNVALVGHGGAGKTSLAEAMLHLAGVTKRLGAVDSGQSVLDYDPEEIKRQFTINLSIAPVVHDGVKINVIDTPWLRRLHRRRDRRHGGRRDGALRRRRRGRAPGPDRAAVEDRRRHGHLARGVHQPDGQGARGLRRRAARPEGEVRRPGRPGAAADGPGSRLPRRGRHHPDEGVPPRGRRRARRRHPRRVRCRGRSRRATRCATRPPRPTTTS